MICRIVFEICPTNEKIEVIADTLRRTLRLINHYAVKSISPEKHSKEYLRKVYKSSHLVGRLTIDFGDLVIMNGTIEIISKRPATRQIIEFKNYKIKETQIKELFDIEEANKLIR